MEKLKGFYYYAGFSEPEFLASNLKDFMDNVVVESNYLGDVTENIKEEINEVILLNNSDIESKEFEEDLKDILYSYSIFFNPTKEELEEMNKVWCLDKDTYLTNIFK